MAILFPEDEDDTAGGGFVGTINTTPLVDIMLVLLIIFLITVPVVIHTVPVNLPKVANQPTQTTPQTITLTVDRQGRMYWNQEAIADPAALLARLAAAATQDPQPAIHIRGDQDTRYEYVGLMIDACQRAGIVKVGFITEPPPQGG